MLNTFCANKRILEKVFNLKNKWGERFEDYRMLLAIDSVSWKEYGYSYIHRQEL